MTLPWLRPVLDDLAGYRPTDGAYASAGRIHPLSANESPHDPLPGVVEAIAQAAGGVNRYPDPGCQELIRSIAGARGVDEDRVAVGAGSVALLQALFQAVAHPHAEVMYAWRSFELYPALADLAGVCSVRVPLVDEAHDLPAMAARITARTRMVLVCNPNNPTGTVLGAGELGRFLARVPGDCLVVLDEAYREYVQAPGAADGLALIGAHPNLVVLRTFSKAYGLAGLRVGYLIGDAQVVARLRKALPPYAVNAVAQRAAIAALGLEDRLQDRVAATTAERERVRDALLAAGWRVPPSEANFLWLPLGDASADFDRWCHGHGTAVRTFPGEGVRVTVGDAGDGDAFLAAAAGWRAAFPAVTP